MPTLALAIFITSTTLLIDICSKRLQPAYRYEMTFFLVAGVGYFIDGMKELKADEIYPYQRYLQINTGVVVLTGEAPEEENKTTTG